MDKQQELAARWGKQLRRKPRAKKQLQPLHQGEQGPPYLVNGFIVTRSYSPNTGRWWVVYSREQWFHGKVREFETKRKADAIAWTRNREVQS
jgi:hypothetical protein